MHPNPASVSIRKQFTSTKVKGVSARGRVVPLSLVALGVVFGDIGTSPLYAFKECLRHGATPADIYGTVSLILWSLILLVSIKYVGIVLRADNDGEGGILALLALAFPEKSRKEGMNAFTIMTALGVFGAALLYGEALLPLRSQSFRQSRDWRRFLRFSTRWLYPLRSASWLRCFRFKDLGRVQSEGCSEK